MSLFSDSMGVVAVSANPVLSSATKHVEIADFFVRELVERQIVTVSYVCTAYMLADVLTKPLGPGKFFSFIGIILGILRENENSADGLEPHGGPAVVPRRTHNTPSLARETEGHTTQCSPLGVLTRKSSAEVGKCYFRTRKTSAEVTRRK